MLCNTKKKKRKGSKENLETKKNQTLFRLLLLLLLSLFTGVRLCATPQTTAHQAPLSLGFSRQEYWSGLPFPSPVQTSTCLKNVRIFFPISCLEQSLTKVCMFCLIDRYPESFTFISCNLFFEKAGFSSFLQKFLDFVG